MDDNDKEPQQQKLRQDERETEAGKASQIPLIHDIIFDEQAPLKAPPRPRRLKNPIDNDHGPDYDPDTLDLFEAPTSKLLSYANEHTSIELRADGDELIENLVEEYSNKIAQRLKEELTDQLHSILEDLIDHDPGRSR